MAPLVPCPSCARHVRASEPSCPFCAATLPSDLAGRAVPAATGRLSRIAAFTFAASVAATGGIAATSAGCGGRIDGGDIGNGNGSSNSGDGNSSGGNGGGGSGGGTGGGGTGDSSTGDSDGAVDDDGGVGLMYGMPGGSDSGAPQPMYGCPAPWCGDGGAGGVDSGAQDDGGIQPAYGTPTTDAGPPDDGGAHTLYGLPPRDD